MPQRRTNICADPRTCPRTGQAVHRSFAGHTSRLVLRGRESLGGTVIPYRRSKNSRFVYGATMPGLGLHKQSLSLCCSERSERNPAPSSTASLLQPNPTPQSIVFPSSTAIGRTLFPQAATKPLISRTYPRSAKAVHCAQKVFCVQSALASLQTFLSQKAQMG